MKKPAAERSIAMAKKRKTTKKTAKKAAKQKAARSKSSISKLKRKAAPKSNLRRVSLRPTSRSAEPSSGSASSSLDPKRAGRLRLNDADESSRRRRIGDLQGISMSDRADSESVGELLEEGQTLEAEAVQGIEDALDADQGEIRTHEVPEDDVPEEYLDNDR
jgi:hypothetical protein